MKNSLIVIFLMLIMSGCERLHHSSSLDETRSGELKENSNNSSHLYISEAHLSRNFMPIVTSNPKRTIKRPLMGFITCRRLDGANISEKMKIANVEIRHENQVWVAIDVRAEIYNPEPDYITVSFRNGPEWEPSTFADISIDYIDDDGDSHKISIKKIAIEKSI